MYMVNIHEAKAKLSEYIEAALKGERVVICNRNKPIAELRPIEQPFAGPRDLSPMFPGATFITDAFFEPMSEAELEEWYGGEPFPARVAESRADYGKPSGGTRKRKPRR